jgi:hypothetical protein
VTERRLVVVFDAPEPEALARFWGTVLGRDAVPEAGGALVPGDETQPGLRFRRSVEGRTGPNLVHLHLTSTDLADQQRTVATVLELGGSHLDVGQRPEEGHVVLADPGGNELCVIEPGNAYLAGCGFLGELAGDGTRDAGLFWSAALDWPLVWEQDEETAIQSARGGTKVAWGGPPLAARSGRSRQRFDVVTPHDLSAEAARLVALGATRLGAAEDGRPRLADPDGTELRLQEHEGRT